jgi:sulfite exporter TauE/SafE
MLNADTAKGAMVVFALCLKTRGDLLANTIQIVRTTKFARMPFALLVVTLLGCLTTEVLLNLAAIRRAKHCQALIAAFLGFFHE